MGFVRVKQDETGHEFTVSDQRPLDGLTVLKKDAVNANGEPLPPKYGDPAGRKAGQSANSKAPAGEGDTTTANSATKKE